MLCSADDLLRSSGACMDLLGEELYLLTISLSYTLPTGH